MARWFIALAYLLVGDHERPALAGAPESTARVRNATVPLYPPLARQAYVQGTVMLEVTTAGQAFEPIRLVSGHPLLSIAAIANLRTWVLDNAPSVTFNVS